MRPTSKMSQNVVACGIDYINKHVDIFPEKTIMHYCVTNKIWDGGFHHRIMRTHFAAHGDYKLTLKKYVSFSSHCRCFTFFHSMFVDSYIRYVGYTLFMVIVSYGNSYHGKEVSNLLELMWQPN